MIKYYLEKIIDKENLSVDEAYSVMTEIMDGRLNNSHLAGLLTALKTKGETPEEIAGFVKAMRRKSIKISCDDDNAVDLCGTGGDNSGTINISTAAAFAAAGAGIRVAKHGNRAVSSHSGSADVMESLGININMPPKYSEEALNTIGIAFLFAPLYHPAMKHAAATRKELGIKTIFNLIGPLTNPAQVKRQLIGVSNNRTAELMSSAAKYLDYEKVCFVCSENKYDEITLTGSTETIEYSGNENTKGYRLNNNSFSYPKISIDELKGESPAACAEAIMRVFKNKVRNSVYYTIAANAAVALFCAGYSSELERCKEAAEESISSYAALEKLNQLKIFSKKAS